MTGMVILFLFKSVWVDIFAPLNLFLKLFVRKSKFSCYLLLVFEILRVNSILRIGLISESLVLG